MLEYDDEDIGESAAISDGTLKFLQNSNCHDRSYQNEENEKKLNRCADKSKTRPENSSNTNR